jgi:hypothetical protein
MFPNACGIGGPYAPQCLYHPVPKVSVEAPHGETGDKNGKPTVAVRTMIQINTAMELLWQGSTASPWQVAQGPN